MYNPPERTAWTFLWNIKAEVALEDLGIDTTEAEIMYSASGTLRVKAGGNWAHAIGQVASGKFVWLLIERRRDLLKLVVHEVIEVSQVEFEDFRRRVNK